MKRYNIMFRNGDGVSLTAIAHNSDGQYLKICDAKGILAVFSWEAIVGFVVKEDT